MAITLRSTKGSPLTWDEGDDNFREVQKLMDKAFVSVSDYGAVGDGVTDDSQAFNDAFSDVGENGVIFAPDGTYILSAINGFSNGQKIIGGSRTTFKVKNQTSGDYLLFSIDTKSNIEFKNIIFDGNTANVTDFDPVIKVVDSSFIKFNECEWKDTKGIGVYFQDCDDCGVVYSYFNNVGAYNIISSNLADRKQAIAFSGTSGPYYRPYVISCVFDTVGLDCVSIAKGTSDGARDAIVSFNRCKTNYAGTLYFSYVDGASIISNIISNGASGGNAIDCINSRNLNISSKCMMHIYNKNASGY
jgi:polygalacturonase